MATTTTSVSVIPLTLLTINDVHVKSNYLSLEAKIAWWWRGMRRGTYEKLK